MKRLLTVMIAISMIASYSAAAFPVDALETAGQTSTSASMKSDKVLPCAASDSETAGDYKITVESNSITINEYTGDAEVLEIPAEINGKQVTKLANYSFSKCGTLKKVTIPDCVTTIGSGVFSNCENLEEINIPADLIKCDGHVISKCPNIKKVDIPEGLTDIHSFFTGAESIKEITLPSTIKNIGSDAFNRCTSLEKINIPDSVTSIGSYAFEDCTSLKEMTLPNGLLSIGYHAFYNCTSLESINYPLKLSETGESIFTGCKSLNKVTVPEGVRELTGFFNRAENLAEVELPSTLKTISRYAFQNCKALNGVKIPDSVTTIGSGAFDGCESLTEIVFPDGVTTIESYAFMGCSKLEKINYPLKLTNAGYEIFSKCPKISSCEVPEGVRNLVRFFYNSSVTEVTLPSTLKSIDDYALYKCASLTEIKVPDGVTSIGMYAFQYDSSLKEAILPDSVTSLGTGVFSDCVILESVNYPLNLESTNSNIFHNCNNLTKITVPEGVKVLPRNVFNDANYLEEVELPSTLEEIGAFAFQNCGNLIELKIPDSVTSIGSYAFEYCHSLEAVTIPENVSILDIATIGSCKGLTEVTLPEGISEIRYGNFLNCPNVTIYGYSNTAAEEYANKNDIPFVSIGEGRRNIGGVHAEINDTFVYSPNSSDCTPKPSVTLDDVILAEGVDYQIEYLNNDKAGEATAKITGIGKYMGTYEVPFMIEQKDIAADDVLMTAFPTYQYTGSEIKPEFDISFKGYRLEEGVDYQVSYEDNIEVGTGSMIVEGIGNYSGSFEKNIYIVSSNPDVGSKSIDISNAQGEISEKVVYSPISSDCEPKPTVYMGDVVLEEGTDYEIEYLNNDKAGEATARIKGMGNYSGTYDIPFTVEQRSVFDEVGVSNLSTQEYTGNAIEPKVPLICKNVSLKENVDYTLTYSDNINPGIAKITVKGIGNYKGEFDMSFTIVESSSNTMGDIDDDGEITVADSLIILRATVDLENLTDEQKRLADLDGDKEITAADSLIVLRQSVGLY